MTPNKLQETFYCIFFYIRHMREHTIKSRQNLDDEKGGYILYETWKKLNLNYLNIRWLE